MDSRKIKNLKRVASIMAEKYALTDVFLFGSVARDEETEDSDIDLLFNTSNMEMDIVDLITMQDDFAEHLGRPVDMITINSARKNEFFYRKVASEAICLYGDTNKLKDTL